MTDEILTPEELMEFLKLDKESLEKVFKDGEMPGRYLGGHWRFSKNAVVRWLGELTMIEVIEYGRQQTMRRQEPPPPAAKRAPARAQNNADDNGHRGQSAKSGGYMNPKHQLAARNFNALTTNQKSDLLAGMG
ncbi:helix-turn-helix domain-containing protein [Planctomycetota bacterium]